MQIQKVIKCPLKLVNEFKFKLFKIEKITFFYTY